MEQTILALLKANVGNANMWRDGWVNHRDVSSLKHYAFALGKVQSLVRLCNEVKVEIPVKFRDDIAQFELDWEESLDVFTAKR